MNRLFSIGTAALVSAVTLVAGWQLSVSGQDIKSDDYGGITGIEPPYDQTPGEHGVILVPMTRAWETDFSKLQTILSTKPESLNPQQLQLLEGGLKNRTEALTEQYTAAGDEARRKELESELAKVVGQHFTVLQAIRDREIAKLEQQVARLRGLLQQREDARQQIVQGRVDQLVRSATGLGWDRSERGPWRTQVPRVGPAAPATPDPAGGPAPAPAAEPAASEQILRRAAQDGGS